MVRVCTFVCVVWILNTFPQLSKESTEFGFIDYRYTCNMYIFIKYKWMCMHVYILVSFCRWTLYKLMSMWPCITAQITWPQYKIIIKYFTSTPLIFNLIISFIQQPTNPGQVNILTNFYIFPKTFIANKTNLWLTQW